MKGAFSDAFIRYLLHGAEDIIIFSPHQSTAFDAPEITLKDLLESYQDLRNRLRKKCLEEIYEVSREATTIPLMPHKKLIRLQRYVTEDGKEVIFEGLSNGKALVHPPGEPNMQSCWFEDPENLMEILCTKQK